MNSEPNIWTLIFECETGRNVHIAIDTYYQYEDGSFSIWMKTVHPDGLIAYCTCRFSDTEVDEIVHNIGKLSSRHIGKYEDLPHIQALAQRIQRIVNAPYESIKTKLN